MNKATLLNTTTQTTETYEVEIDGKKYNLVWYCNEKNKVMDEALTDQRTGQLVDDDALIEAAGKLALAVNP